LSCEKEGAVASVMATMVIKIDFFIIVFCSLCYADAKVVDVRLGIITELEVCFALFPHCPENRYSTRCSDGVLLQIEIGGKING
jgi:hypothetical protein